MASFSLDSALEESQPLMANDQKSSVSCYDDECTDQRDKLHYERLRESATGSPLITGE